MALEELVAVCRPPPAPDDPVTQARWASLELAVGRALPADYRAFLERFGSGAFGAENSEGAFFDLAFVVTPTEFRTMSDLERTILA